jgi:hypothetical protein
MPPNDADAASLAFWLATSSTRPSARRSSRSWRPSLHPWTEHHSTYNVRRSWAAFALKGYKQDDPAFIAKPSEMSREWKAANRALCNAPCQLTAAAPRFPATLAVVERLGTEAQRVRFMRLKEGGGILVRHSDSSDKC